VRNQWVWTLGDPNTANIEYLVSIYQKLNVRIITEGIETEEQAQHIQALECKLGKIFFLGTPLAPNRQ